MSTEPSFLVRDFDGGVVFLKPLVSTVGVDMRMFWQWWGPAADFEVMDPTGRGLGNADDASLFRDGDFGFDGVTFFLAGIPAPLFAAWSLDWLLRTIDDLRFGFLTADLDRAFDPKNPHGQIFDPPQGPADGRLIPIFKKNHR